MLKLPSPDSGLLIGQKQDENTPTMRTDVMKIASVFFMVLLSGGCETIFESSGVVVQKNNQHPLDSVVVSLVVGGGLDRSTLTDSLGRFRLVSGVHGCVPSCPDAVVTFRKRGFKQIELVPERDTMVEMETEATP